MFVKITEKKAGGKIYRSLHIVQAYREQGKPKQRIIANFGNIRHFKEKDIDKIIDGLCRVFNRPRPEGTTLPLDLDKITQALDYGHIHAISHIWWEVKWREAIIEEGKGNKCEFDLDSHVKTMVINRLCDPTSKLRLLDWLEGVYLPGIDRTAIEYHNLLRAMDWLIEHKEVLEKKLTCEILTLFDTELDLVFYDTTSSYFETNSDDDLLRWGYSRDHRSDLPQVIIGIVMTPDGIPIAHHVFPGNTADRSTFKEVILDLKRRFPIKRCIIVADRGMLKEANLKTLEEEGLGHIMSIRMKENRAFARKLPNIHKELMEKWERLGDPTSKEDIYVDTKLEGRRLIVAYNGNRGSQSRRLRDHLIQDAEEEISRWIDKLNNQDAGRYTTRGRRLTDQGVLLKIHDLLGRKGLLSYYKVFLDKDGLVRFHINRKKRNQQVRLDGILAVVTREKDLSCEEVIKQYKGLQDVERGFRTLKSSLDVRPMYHWKERRIRAHIFICVMALQIHRLMRLRLKKAGSSFSPDRALEKLSRLRTIHADVGGREHIGLTKPTEIQLLLFKELEVPKPTARSIGKPMV